MADPDAFVPERDDTSPETTPLTQAQEARAARAGLEEHYEANPGTRPSLHAVAHVLAVMDRSPLALRRDLLERASAEVRAVRHDADADDVLLWAEGLLRRSSGS